MEKSMKTRKLVYLCAVVSLSIIVTAQTATQSNAKVERGRYLVTRVGKCQDCHTPHNQRGEEIKEKWLQGSPLPFQPIVEMPWVGTAPPIAGLEGWTDAQAIKFLTTGIRKDGTRAAPPMPEYQFNRTDAEAVVAYLRSFKQPPAKVETKN
jgi:mono/diheme cytochrome c family protein